MTTKYFNVMLFQYLLDRSRTPFNTKRVSGTGVKVVQGYDESRKVVTLRAQDSDFEIAFGGFTYGASTQSPNSGVTITCPSSSMTYLAGFPDVICCETLKLMWICLLYF